jgi:hypothetical protein
LFSISIWRQVRTKRYFPRRIDEAGVEDGNTLSEIGSQPDFGLIPSRWQMLPFFKMEAPYYKWVARASEVTARSDADLDATMAHAGHPADTRDMRSQIKVILTPRGNAGKP